MHLDPSLIADRLRALEATHRLFWAIDARRWDLVAETCAADAVAAWRDLPPGPLAHALRLLFAGVLTHHLLTNPLIELDGDWAEVSALMEVRHRQATLRGSDGFTRLSQDRVRLRRVGDAWRVTGLFREPGIAEGNPGLLPGTGDPAPPAPTPPLAPETPPRDAAERDRRTADRLAIHDLMMRFGRGLDAKDWALYRACFADRVLVDFAQTTGRPPRAVDADGFVAFARMRQRGHASFHQYSNFQVHVDGDRARCILYLVARHQAPRTDGDPRNVFVGWYDNEFVRTTAGWRISALRHPLQWVEGNAAIKDAPDPEAEALGRELFTLDEVA